MKSIKNTDYSTLTDYPNKFRECHAEIENLVDEANQKIADVVARLNDYIDEANGFVSDLASEAENYHDERSDTWRDSEAGSNYYDWLCELQSAAGELEGREYEVDASSILDDIETMAEALENVRQSPND